MKNKKLFVAFSHVLTESQVEGFNSQFGKDHEDSIVTLKEVDPELQAQMSAISATATLEEIQLLALRIVSEAIMEEATHFYCTGEPTLTMWANLYAHYKNAHTSLVCIQSTTERKSVELVNPDGSVTKTTVFQHVQWREMF